MILRIRHRRLVFVLGSAVVGLALMHAASLGFDAFHSSRVSSQLVEWFSLEGEGNFPALFSALLLLGAATQFLVIGQLSQQSKIQEWRRHWLALAGVFAFLAIDEAAMIHEKFDNNTLLSFVETKGLLAWPWVILYGGLCLAFTATFFRFGWTLSQACAGNTAQLLSCTWEPLLVSKC